MMTIIDAVDRHVLDYPVWASLTGPHAHFAEIRGRAARYPGDVAPFHALADPTDPRAWADLAALVGPGASIAMAGAPLEAFPGWAVDASIAGVQFVDVALRAAVDPSAEVLTADDVPEILDLIARCRPGPFLRRTIELGSYLGLRHQGRLVAMAGERLHPPGWTASPLRTLVALEPTGGSAHLSVKRRSSPPLLTAVRRRVLRCARPRFYGKETLVRRRSVRQIWRCEPRRSSPRQPR